jgi:hypothetical protein
MTEPTPDAVQLPHTIVCVDCGGAAHLLQSQEGDTEGSVIAAYRCELCLDRWDVEFELD